MLSKISLVSLVAIFSFSLCHAQEKITLQNPSFEDMPRKGGDPLTSIKSWHDCGLSKFPGESPPDIHPVPANAWEVSKDPYDGNTFLGMVTRYNDTYESLSQLLSAPLKGGVCYSFTAFLARSELYKSATHRNPDPENFVKPAVLLIWGGNSFCDKGELLGESPAVTNSDWKQYKFLFQPQRTYMYITIEVFYKTPILEAYNGHILIDNFSEIVQTDCPLFPQDLVAEVSDPPAKVEIEAPGSSTISSSTTTKKSGPVAKPADNKGSSTTPPFKAVLLPELGGQKVFVGQKIRLNHLFFMADSVNLLSGSYKVLDELAAYLKAHPKTIIEIGGHTNTIPPDDYCNELSKARAKSVQEYLISRGIPDYRLKFKGYGKTDPLIPYDKYNREARVKNQRVEIKILSLS